MLIWERVAPTKTFETIQIDLLDYSINYPNMLTRTQYHSATSLRIFCETAELFGVSHEQCLADTKLTFDQLSNPELKPKVTQEFKAVENIAEAAKSIIGIGATAGKRMHVNVFGAWGFAILTSPTLRAAILTAIDYLKISFVLAEIHLDEHEGMVRVWFDMSDLPPPIRQIYAERHCVVTMNFVRELLAAPLKDTFVIETRIDDPQYARSLSELLELDVIPDCEHYGVVFSSELLDKPLPKSDPVTLKYCLKQCEALMQQASSAEKLWTQKVRDVILENIADEQRIDSIAESLAMTERTLRRRLTEEGTNFRELYTGIRLSIAHELIESTGLNIETVSWRIGYAEPASFVRAFSKRFGITPGEVKKQSKT